MKDLLNITGKVDPNVVEILRIMHLVTTELAMPYIVVGATARDLVLHYGYGAPIERATGDVDFAMQVPDWTAFNILKSGMVDRGFKETTRQHRLIGPNDTLVDIIPFGAIENADADIIWPPNGDKKMNVLGFQEAFEYSDQVCVQENPELVVPVVSPVGLVLLKLIAWTDRAADLRKRDATDIAYLFSTYERIGEVLDALYEENYVQIMDRYDWDVTQAASHLLGQRARNIAEPKTAERITALVEGNLGSLDQELLAREMCERVETQFEKNETLLSAFVAGFNEQV